MSTHTHKDGMTYYTPEGDKMTTYAAMDDLRRGYNVIVYGFDPEAPITVGRVLTPADEIVIPE